jgi:hypothetical protein
MTFTATRKREETLLLYPNGTPTGNKLIRSNLLYPGHQGMAQLDYKEIVTWNGVKLVFQRGGYVPDHDPVPYGHIRKDALFNHLGDPKPAGDGRGSYAPLMNRTVTLSVQSIPLEMGYKTASASRFDNYGNPGIKYNADGWYSYMTWSTPRTEAGPHSDSTTLGTTVDGGGIVRALIPNGGHLDLCSVNRIHCASLDSTGKRNGTVTFAYCHRSGLRGWVVVAHQYKNRPVVHHIV